NVTAVVEHSFGFPELEDRCDDDLSRVLFQELLQFLARLGLHEIWYIGRVECGTDLRVKVDAVDDDQHNWIAECRLQPELLRGKDHEERLPRALEVPDQPFPRLAGEHALHDEVCCLVLLVTTDEFDAALLAVSREKSEVRQDVENDSRAKQPVHS